MALKGLKDGWILIICIYLFLLQPGVPIGTYIYHHSPGLRGWWGAGYKLNRSSVQIHPSACPTESLLVIRLLEPTCYCRAKVGYMQVANLLQGQTLTLRGNLRVTYKASIWTVGGGVQKKNTHP